MKRPCLPSECPSIHPGRANITVQPQGCFSVAIHFRARPRIWVADHCTSLRFTISVRRAGSYACAMATHALVDADGSGEKIVPTRCSARQALHHGFPRLARVFRRNRAWRQNAYRNFGTSASAIRLCNRRRPRLEKSSLAAPQTLQICRLTVSRLAHDRSPVAPEDKRQPIRNES